MVRAPRVATLSAETSVDSPVLAVSHWSYDDGDGDGDGDGGGDGDDGHFGEDYHDQGECGGARPPDTKTCNGACLQSNPRQGKPNGWTRLEEEALQDNVSHLEDLEDEAYEDENYDSALDHTVRKQVEDDEDADHRHVSPNPK